jgi:glycosyltransferase involved in cell wall biosynthesis
MSDARDPAMPHLPDHLQITMPIATSERPSESRDFKSLPAPRPITEHQWPEGTRPLVSICCITYNHEKFIKQCIDGFLMQETSFPVEIIIHDDASTDRTADIIRACHAKYPRLFRPILQKENQYQQGKRRILLALLPFARGKYIAVCEGDDYWTGKDKLQLQSIFLNDNPSCALCHHRVSYLKDATGEIELEYPPTERRLRRVDGDLLAQGNFIQTCSLILRRGWIPPLTDGFKALKLGDWPLCALVSQRGWIGYIDRNMAVYRLHSGGLWSASSDTFRCSATRDMIRFLALNLNRRCRRPWVTIVLNDLEYNLAVSSKRGALKLTAEAGVNLVWNGTRVRPSLFFRFIYRAARLFAGACKRRLKATMLVSLK